MWRPLLWPSQLIDHAGWYFLPWMLSKAKSTYITWIAMCQPLNAINDSVLQCILYCITHKSKGSLLIGNWSIVRYTRPPAYASFRHCRFSLKKIKVDQVHFLSLVETTSALWDSNIIALAEALAESTNSGPARRSKGEAGGQSSDEFAI